MGVKGLLPFLGVAGKKAHSLSFVRGKKVGLDVSFELHKVIQQDDNAQLICNSERAVNPVPLPPKVWQKLAESVLNKVIKLTKQLGANVICVFSGLAVPSKVKVNETRADARELSLIKALQAQEAG